MTDPSRSSAATPALVLLAAGTGTRFAAPEHKLTARLSGGRTVFDVSVAAAVDAAQRLGAPLVVVTGAVLLELPENVIEVHNARFADGQATSLTAAIDAARVLGADSAVIGLADQPFVTTEAWMTVARSDLAQPIVAATYDGRRGNPVRLAREVWSQLPASGDEGARALMRIRPELVGEVPCTGSPADIDTVEELRRWQNS